MIGAAMMLKMCQKHVFAPKISVFSHVHIRYVFNFKKVQTESYFLFSY